MAKKFFNLIILDKSGSMSSIREQAIGGVNETIGTIRVTKKDTGTEQYLTLVSFCDCEQRYTYDKTPIDQVKMFTSKDYQPCCCTPLLDAIGNACSKLRNQLYEEKEDCAVSVTIITDGYENASREWKYSSVQALIKELKAKGWLFAFIGANVDVMKVSQDLAIDNALSFEATPEGTQEMFVKEREARAMWARRRAVCCDEEDVACANMNYFKEEDK